MQTFFSVNSFKAAGIRFFKKNQLFIFPALMLFMISCNKEHLMPAKTYNQGGSEEIQKKASASQSADNGATQISGVGFFAEADECNSPVGQGAAYAVRMTGDLSGCLYVFVDEFACSPSGTYREQGREYFVGTYKGEAGTFWTTYKFESKFEGCAPDGSPLGAEIFGRCQHPIVKGSGTGVFDGVTGRMDFKDDIEAGNFPYRGHLKF
ncbi:hypothetical protein BH20BAC1_BH20BAC1_25700 [soil metagenome]